MTFDADETREALRLLGELLEFRGEAIQIAVIGGSALLLADLSNRATQDVDVVGVVKEAEVVAGRLPQPIRDAAEAVAADLGLPLAWLNTGPDSLTEAGLPIGFLERTAREQFGSLTLFIADRFDQIHFKLYAGVDQGPTSKHIEDLRGLQPSADELLTAAAWCRTHDPSEGFAQDLVGALHSFGVSYDR